MSTNTTTPYYELTQRFFQAYNDMDLSVLETLLADDVRWGHRNRFSGSGRNELIKSFQDIQTVVPERQFGEILRSAESANIFYCEHRWDATPAVDDPSWGWKPGVPVFMDVVSVLTFEDGRIVAWVDYA